MVKYVGKFISNIIFIIVIIVFIACIANNNVKKKNRKLVGDNYINSSKYPQFIGDTVNNVNNNEVFFVGSYLAKPGYIRINVQSKNKLTYSEFEEQANLLVNNVYELIKDKTIKKEGILSTGNYTISFEFYKKFKKWNMYDYILVGFIQISTEKIQKRYSFDECISGSISELEWQQEQ